MGKEDRMKDITIYGKEKEQVRSLPQHEKWKNGEIINERTSIVTKCFITKRGIYK